MKKLALFVAFGLVMCSIHATPKDPVTDSERQAIYKIGDKMGVPRSIVRQLGNEESQWYADAVSRMTPEGYHSRGVFQIYDKPGNLDWLLWKFWKGDPATFDIYDPIDNATLALAYLAWLHDRYGNWFQALCYYNHGDVKGYSEDTRAYALRIINAR